MNLIVTSTVNNYWLTNPDYVSTDAGVITKQVIYSVNTVNYEANMHLTSCFAAIYEVAITVYNG